ncbi:hypothetical protein [Actinobacillus vicugnae]|uniref:hypothetical protein n=1 Tax=Actinobacillus vicugnae TaxID=2573093 RepID=UPI001242828B|nr:hypothetical protein [Actinobacillus vicugnae]
MIERLKRNIKNRKPTFWEKAGNYFTNAFSYIINELELSNIKAFVHFLPAPIQKVVAPVLKYIPHVSIIKDKVQLLLSKKE